MSSALLLSLAPVVLSAAPQLNGGVEPDRGAQSKVSTAQDPGLIAGPAELGGELYDPKDPPVVMLGMGGPNTFAFQLNLEHRRWKEEFVVVLPDPTAFPPPRLCPVLTLFHGYGETPLAVVNNTELDDEAASRGWLVVIPLGAHTYNYGIDYAQDNIEDVFAHVALFAANPQMPLFGYEMDRERVYAVGFSMGGGAAASFAARHLDPSHVRFAAVVNHTGSTSLRDTYNFGGNASLFQNPLMFGGSPTNAPFRYQRSSAIDLKPGNIVDPETDMVRNLVHVPIFHFSASNDPNPYLVTQSHEMFLRHQLWGGESTWTTVPSPTHSWATLPLDVLDDLESRSLQSPPEGTPIPVLADRDGRWHFFELRQARDKRLSPFTFEWSSGLNSLAFDDVENVASLAVDLTDPSLRLNPVDRLELDLQTRTLEPLDIVLHGYSARPSSIVRDFVVVPATQAEWSPAAQTLTLRETFGVFGGALVGHALSWAAAGRASAAPLEVSARARGTPNRSGRRRPRGA